MNIKTWPRQFEWYKSGVLSQRDKKFLKEEIGKVERLDYGRIYGLSCMEENMSPVVTKLHPYLRLRAPTDIEERRAILEDNQNTESPRKGFEKKVLVPQGPIDGFCPFDNIPPPILVKILQHVLVFRGKVVHALSRLDPHYEPDGVPANINGRCSLLHRFHVGTESVSLTFASHPQDLLAPLLVNKVWSMVGINIFYGENVFAFSSLGE